LGCPDIRAKIFIFPKIRNKAYLSAVPLRQEGRFAIVTNVKRDAMDANVLSTNSTDADGKIVWSWHPLAGAKPATMLFALRR